MKINIYDLKFSITVNMKYERLFETQAVYEEAALNLTYPCIVYIVSSDRVRYVKTSSDTGVEIEDGITIYLTDGTSVNLGTLATITEDSVSSYKSTAQSVIIRNGTTTIGASAFCNFTQLKTVVLPEGLVVIGDAAFQGCTAIDQINIPSTVTTLSAYAFDQCSSLKSIDLLSCQITELNNCTFRNCAAITNINLPNNFEYIGFQAFQGCSNLSAVTIPKTVTSIGDYAFDGCSSSLQLNFSGTSNDWANVSKGTGAIPSTATVNCNDSTNKYIQTYADGSVIYSDTIVSKNLTRIEFTEYCNTIANDALQNCKTLQSVTISKSVTSIGTKPFGGCIELTSLTISSDNPKYFDGGCNCIIDKTSNTLIQGCKTTGAIPSTVTTIGEYAFISIPITSINTLIVTVSDEDEYPLYIPESVTAISGYAFYFCSSLKTVTLPNTVTSLGTWVFRQCTQLTSMVFPSRLTSIPDYTCLDCCSLASVTLPTSVHTIGYEAFCGHAMESFTVPSTVTTIGAMAFQAFTSMNVLYVPSTVATIGENAFKSIKKVVYTGTATGSPWGAQSVVAQDESGSLESPVYADNLGFTSEELTNLTSDEQVEVETVVDSILA